MILSWRMGSETTPSPSFKQTRSSSNFSTNFIICITGSVMQAKSILLNIFNICSAQFDISGRNHSEENLHNCNRENCLAFDYSIKIQFILLIQCTSFQSPLLTDNIKE